MANPATKHMLGLSNALSGLIPGKSQGASGFSPAFNRSSLNFDGTHSYVKVDVAMGDLGTCTISIWVYDDSSLGPDYQFLFDGRGDGDGTAALAGTINIYSNAIVVSSGTVYVDGVATTSITADQWSHVVVTGIAVDIDEDIKIGGKWNAAGNLGGKIADVSIFDAVITPSDLRNGSTPANLRRMSNLVGWWRMGDGTEKSNGTTIYDMSKNSNNGTYTDAGDGIIEYSASVPS